MSSRTLITVSLATAAVAGCGSSAATHSQSAAPSSGGAEKVVIQGYAYKPAALTVSRGSKVTFTNRDSTAHTATVSGGAFDTGTVAPGQSKTINLTRPGTYSYICQFHPFMHGQVSVTG